MIESASFTWLGSPFFLAGLQSYNDSDTASLRYGWLRPNRVYIYVEEEQSYDYEMEHAKEAVGWLVVRSGTLQTEPNPTKLRILQTTPTNAAQHAADALMSLEFNQKLHQQSSSALAIYQGTYDPSANPTSFTALEVNSVCRGLWQVENSNSQALSFTWQSRFNHSQEQNTTQNIQNIQGLGVVAANSSAYFTTTALLDSAISHEAMQVEVNGQAQTVGASSNQACTAEQLAKRKLAVQVKEQKVNILAQLESKDYSLVVSTAAQSHDNEYLAEPYTLTFQASASSLPAPWQLTTKAGIGTAKYDSTTKKFTLHTIPNQAGTAATTLLYQNINANNDFNFQACLENDSAGLMLLSQDPAAADLAILDYLQLAIKDQKLEVREQKAGSQRVLGVGTLTSPACLRIERKGDLLYVFEADTSMKWQLVKQVYRASAVVGLAIVLQSNVMAQGDVGQVYFEEIERVNQTIIIPPGAEEFVDSQGLIFRLAEDQVIDLPIIVEFRRLILEELPENIQVSIKEDPGETSGYAPGTPLALYAIRAYVEANELPNSILVEVYLPTPTLLNADDRMIFSGRFLDKQVNGFERDLWLKDDIFYSEDQPPTHMRAGYFRINQGFPHRLTPEYYGIFSKQPIIEDFSKNSSIDSAILQSQVGTTPKLTTNDFLGIHAKCYRNPTTKTYDCTAADAIINELNIALKEFTSCSSLHMCFPKPRILQVDLYYVSTMKGLLRQYTQVSEAIIWEVNVGSENPFSVDQEFKDYIRHELFHAIHYAYSTSEEWLDLTAPYNPYGKRVYNKEDYSWFVESVAQIATRSTAAKTQASGGVIDSRRDIQYSWNEVNVPTKASGLHYKSQDFWAYLGIKYNLGLYDLLDPVLTSITSKISSATSLNKEWFLKAFDEAISNHSSFTYRSTSGLANEYWDWVKNQALLKNINIVTTDSRGNIDDLGKQCHIDNYEVIFPFLITFSSFPTLYKIKNFFVSDPTNPANKITADVKHLGSRVWQMTLPEPATINRDGSYMVDVSVSSNNANFRYIIISEDDVNQRQPNPLPTSNYSPCQWVEDDVSRVLKITKETKLYVLVSNVNIDYVTNIDATLKIDEVKLDMDDGSIDGNQRILITTRSATVKSKRDADGIADDIVDNELLYYDNSTDFDNQDVDINLEFGDGGNRPTKDHVDMSDFRTFRDWLLQAEAEAGNLLNIVYLNGTTTTFKRNIADPNIPFRFGDYNLDGELSLTKRSPLLIQDNSHYIDVTGSGAAVDAEGYAITIDANKHIVVTKGNIQFHPNTDEYPDIPILNDFEVFYNLIKAEQLWQDTSYALTDLPALLSSGDIEVWPHRLFHLKDLEGNLLVKEALSQVSYADDPATVLHSYTHTSTSLDTQRVIYTLPVELKNSKKRNFIIKLTITLNDNTKIVREKLFEVYLGSDELWDPTPWSLDIDDGTPDGNQWEIITTPSSTNDADNDGVAESLNANELLQFKNDYTHEDADGNKKLGDTSFDMADFRRLRDWFLLSEGIGNFAGSANHPKKKTDITAHYRWWIDYNGSEAVSLDINGVDELGRATDERPSVTMFGTDTSPALFDITIDAAKVTVKPQGNLAIGKDITNRDSDGFPKLTDFETFFALANQNANAWGDAVYPIAKLPHLLDSGDVEVWPRGCLALSRLAQDDGVLSFVEGTSTSGIEVAMGFRHKGTERDSASFIYTLPTGSYHISFVVPLQTARGKRQLVFTRTLSVKLGDDTLLDPFCPDIRHFVQGGSGGAETELENQSYYTGYKLEADSSNSAKRLVTHKLSPGNQAHLKDIAPVGKAGRGETCPQAHANLRMVVEAVALKEAVFTADFGTVVTPEKIEVEELASGASLHTYTKKVRELTPISYTMRANAIHGEVVFSNQAKFSLEEIIDCLTITYSLDTTSGNIVDCKKAVSIDVTGTLDLPDDTFLPVTKLSNLTISGNLFNGEGTLNSEQTSATFSNSSSIKAGYYTIGMLLKAVDSYGAELNKQKQQRIEIPRISDDCEVPQPDPDCKNNPYGYGCPAPYPDPELPFNPADGSDTDSGKIGKVIKTYTCDGIITTPFTVTTVFIINPTDFTQPISNISYNNGEESGNIAVRDGVMKHRVARVFNNISHGAKKENVKVEMKIQLADGTVKNYTRRYSVGLEERRTDKDCKGCSPPPPPPLNDSAGPYVPSEPGCEPKEPEEPVGPGDSYGEPHLRTYDGLGYDFQAAGDYLLTRSLLPNDDFEVQVRYIARFQTTGAADRISVAAAVAMMIDGIKVEVYAGEQGKLNTYVNEKLVSDLPIVLPTAVITSDTTSYARIKIFTHDGKEIKITGFAPITPPIITDVNILLPPKYFSKVEGLMGNGDDIASNDLRLPSGALLPQTTQEYLYFGANPDEYFKGAGGNTYRDSWSLHYGISKSLFSQGSDPFSRTYPRDLRVLDSIDTSVLNSAYTRCRDAGVTDPWFLRSCAYDVAVTGDERWIAVALGLPTHTNYLSLSPSIHFVAQGQARELVFRAFGRSENKNISSENVQWSIKSNNAGNFTINDLSFDNYSARLRLPADTPLGEYTITAQHKDSDLQASAMIIVGEELSVTPKYSVITVGESQEFTAWGAADIAIEWQATGTGRLDIAGRRATYTTTANTSPGSYAVTATVTGDTNVVARGYVHILDKVLSPNNATIFADTTIPMQWLGTAGLAVDWSATAGAISSTGVYTAPSQVGTYTISATLRNDRSKTISTNVTIVEKFDFPANTSFLGAGSHFSTQLNMNGTVTHVGFFDKFLSDGKYPVRLIHNADGVLSNITSLYIRYNTAIAIDTNGKSWYWDVGVLPRPPYSQSDIPIAHPKTPLAQPILHNGSPLLGISELSDGGTMALRKDGSLWCINLYSQQFQSPVNVTLKAVLDASTKAPLLDIQSIGSIFAIQGEQGKLLKVECSNNNLISEVLTNASGNIVTVKQVVSLNRVPIILKQDNRLYKLLYQNNNGSNSYKEEVLRYANGQPVGNVQKVVSAHNHILFTVAGKVWSMGYNSYGQLGHGANQTADSINHPRAVVAQDGTQLSNIKSLAASLSHSLALDNNGQLWAWGSNKYGELGLPVEQENYYYAVPTNPTVGSP